jgi:hypothetical protein
MAMLDGASCPARIEASNDGVRAGARDVDGTISDGWLEVFRLGKLVVLSFLINLSLLKLFVKGQND